MKILVWNFKTEFWNKIFDLAFSELKKLPHEPKISHKLCFEAKSIRNFKIFTSRAPNKLKLSITARSVYKSKTTAKSQPSYYKILFANLISRRLLNFSSRPAILNFTALNLKSAPLKFTTERLPRKHAKPSADKTKFIGAELSQRKFYHSAA